MSDSESDSDAQPLPAIHAAVRNLDVEALRRALAAGANVDAIDESGRTPLYVACKARPPPSVVTMAPPIWREKVREREAIVAALLRAGANVNARCGMYPTVDLTPLMAAVYDRDFPPSSIVAQLMAAGAEIEATDDHGFFVLYTAARNACADTVARLIAAGANVHRRLRVPKYTAMEGATLTRNVRAYAPLLRAGATLPPISRRNAYLRKIAATPGGYRAYERAHRARLAAIFIPKFPGLPVEVIHHIVSIWADCGGH
ncbi:unnamed protein product [Pelagomonas calceolata]|uniref:Ankyrin repeat domain-containing protein n=1 Tax=Pelagomonas calceolata TaxID=35677 RepID=A0A7S4EBX4_9STRA|nr:unnamed protein product [Pelagomonas calceolata]